MRQAAFCRAATASLSYACGVSCRARAERACAPPQRGSSPQWPGLTTFGSPAPRYRGLGVAANLPDVSATLPAERGLVSEGSITALELLPASRLGAPCMYCS